jgi:hypothetical protein
VLAAPAESVCVSEAPTMDVLDIATEGASVIHPVGDSVRPPVPATETHHVGVLSSSPAIISRKPPQPETPPVSDTKTAPVGVSTVPFILELTPPIVSEIRQVKLRPVRSIQDGLTPGEFLLLTEMFKAGIPMTGTKDRRLNAGGYRTLSERTRQDPKTVKRNRQGLLKKFCVEEIRANSCTEATQFRVFHFETILKEWRARGLNWVCRCGRTVQITTGSTGGVFNTPPVGITAVPTGGVSKTAPDAATETTVGEDPPPPVGVLPSVLSNANTNKSTSTTAAQGTGASPVVATAIINAFGFVDDHALQLLIHRCRQNSPDATEEEIGELGAMTARRILRLRNVTSPVGLLIEQTAKCFIGKPFAMYRQERAERERRFAAELNDDQL